MGMPDTGSAFERVRSETTAAIASMGTYLGGPISNAWRIARKEMNAFFSSLAAVIFIGAFLAATLFTFFWVERFFARNIADVRPLFEWMPVLLIFLVSALTMRMWSEERRSGTLEFLMTSPVKPLHMVLGKFLACLGLVGIALALTLPLPFTVAVLGPLDWGPVIGGYVATLFLAAAYISIGLFVSSRTDSQIVSLIVTAIICGAFYVLGSPAITSLAGNWGGELLRLFGSGSRFQSITRGVIDLRDIYYYLSILGVFFVLNLYSLEQLRWSGEGRQAKHMQWRLVAGLVIANLIAANVWLGQVSWARADLTDGNIYSISPASRTYLQQLQEPLLIRGYFSKETHPLLAPLVPRIRDLMREYEVAGGGNVRVEFVDPAGEPELEKEAQQRYQIRAVPFQTANKYQTSVTNSYFNILVKYGDEFETIGYQDLIEVKQGGQGGIDVELRNPEYDLTRAIKKVLYSYRAGGDVFTGVPDKIELQAYVSDPATLPEPLPKLKEDLDALIKQLSEKGGAKFSASVQNPTADGGQLAKQLQTAYGLRPLAVGLLDQKQFWFHIVLRSGDKAVQVQLPDSLDKEGLERNIEAELKRFRPGALRSVALYTPPAAPPMPQMGMPPQAGPRFQVLEAKLRENSVVELASLKEGRVPANADILVVAAPENLDDNQVFAIDQFLMRGGTVMIAAAPFKASLAGNVEVKKAKTGLEGWLKHHGLTLQDAMVLDPQNTPFPVPVDRDVGGFKVRDIQLLPYPPFVDVRDAGLAQEKAPTTGLTQLTLSWAAPIAIDKEKAKGRKITHILESSPQAWTSDAKTIVPDFQKFPRLGFETGKDTGAKVLGALMEGRFSSFYAGKASPLAKDAKPKDDKASDENATPGAGKATEDTASITGVIERSPDSARILLVGSGTFMSDDVLELAGSIDRTQYLTPVLFAENAIDWSLEDRGLLEIRSRGGKFSRTLGRVSESGRAFWEYFNYALAFLGLGGIYVIRRAMHDASARRQRAALGLQEG